MIGRVDRLCTHKAIEHYKAKGLDFSMLFHQSEQTDPEKRYNSSVQAKRLDDHLDWEIIKKAQVAIDTVGRKSV